MHENIFGRDKAPNWLNLNIMELTEKSLPDHKQQCLQREIWAMTTPRQSPLETSSENSENHASKTNPEFWPAVVAFLIIPIYTLLITVIAIKIVYYSGGYKFLRNALGIKLIFVLLICVAGFSVRSLECARTIFTNPFRAFSVGRYVFGFFILVNLTCNIIFEWPQICSMRTGSHCRPKRPRGLTR